MKEKLTGRDKLLDELAAAARDIDEEGLVFLIEQANVLLHNARVRELEEKRSAAQPASPAPPSARKAPSASIDTSADGKAFFLVLGDVRKSLSRAELNQILGICHASPDALEAARRLYTHLGRERRDILVDASIGGATSPLLVALAEHARARAGKAAK
jgi:hypothetical protein